MDDDLFEGIAVWVAGLAVIVVGVACLFGADWVVPPDEGAGPFLTPGREHAFHVIAICAAVLAGGCLLWSVVTRTMTPLLIAVLIGVVVAMFAAPMYGPRNEIDLRADGFSDDWYSAGTRGRVVFFNTTGADLTICLGTVGDCDSSAKGPGRLRSPGLTVPSNHRVAVTTPGKAGDFRLTLVNPGTGVARRDALLHTYVPDTAAP